MYVMKQLVISILTLTVALAFAQGPNHVGYINSNSFDEINTGRTIDENGFIFEILDAGISTKYTEYGSGFFRDKFIMVSSKKVGGLAKTDPNTGEGFKNLFCLDVEEDGRLRKPLLFSHLINTMKSEGQISFSPDEHTMYFTRSNEDDTKSFSLYKTVLEPGSNGNWTDQVKLDINKAGFSIENPSVTPNGKQLYFSSNKSGGYGGYDIYVANILEDGTLDEPKNIGDRINTDKDDKFPTFSKDGDHLFFASEGHVTLGGFDLFRSRIGSESYSLPLNLGTTINTKFDEVAMYFASKSKGYLASSKSFGKGRLDIFKFELTEVLQTIEGKVLDIVTLLPLENATLTLRDQDGGVLSVSSTSNDAKYEFEVKPFEKYTITVEKDGFDPKVIEFQSTKGDDRTYLKNVLLAGTKAEIVEVDEELIIKVENIYFDFDKASIKKESTITLNKVYDVLTDNPSMAINIKAHTDNSGSASYNLRLSDKRAKSAKAYLISKGIPASRIDAKGYGETDLLFNCGANCSKEQDEQNRRIEFVIEK